MYHRPYTEKTIEQMKNNVPQNQIIKTLKKDLSEMKSRQKKWLKEARKELDKTPSYESPRGIGPDFSAEIIDLQLAIATLTDFDITKSILPQNKGEIIYAIEKDPKNIVYIKDIPLSSDNFEYALRYIPLIDKLDYKDKDTFKKELLKAVFLNNKEKVDELFNKYSEKIEEKITEDNISR